MCFAVPVATLTHRLDFGSFLASCLSTVGYLLMSIWLVLLLPRITIYSHVEYEQLVIVLSVDAV